MGNDVAAHAWLFPLYFVDSDFNKREAVLAVPAGRVGLDLLPHELPREALNLGLLGRQLEVHAGIVRARVTLHAPTSRTRGAAPLQPVPLPQSLSRLPAGLFLCLSPAALNLNATRRHEGDARASLIRASV